MSPIMWLLKDGMILNWCILSGEHVWAVVIPRRSAIDLPITPISTAGEAMMLGNDAANAAVQFEAKVNHTGNHYRKKKVGVLKPTDGRARG